MSKICSGFDEWPVSPKASGSEIGGRMSSLDRVERNRVAAEKYKEVRNHDDVDRPEGTLCL
jgi:hypothetical protein